MNHESPWCPSNTTSKNQAWKRFFPMLIYRHTGGMVRWLKKSSNETCLTLSHMLYMICMRNRDGSVSKSLKISITCLFTEMVHFLSHLTIPPLHVNSHKMGASCFVAAGPTDSLRTVVTAAVTYRAIRYIIV